MLGKVKELGMGDKNKQHPYSCRIGGLSFRKEFLLRIAEAKKRAGLDV